MKDFSYSDSFYKSDISLFNTCSFGNINSIKMDCKVIKANYSKIEEKLILSLYHLRKNKNKIADQFSINVGNKSKKSEKIPISSLLVLPKNYKNFYSIDKFVNPISESERNTNPPVNIQQLSGDEEELNLNVQNPVDNNQNTRTDLRTNQSLVSFPGSFDNLNANMESTDQRNNALNLRQIINQLEKKNPYKSVNTAGMINSHCGKKFLVGYKNNHLKFWNLFKDKNLEIKNDINFSLLHEWR